MQEEFFLQIDPPPFEVLAIGQEAIRQALIQDEIECVAKRLSRY